MKLSAPALLFLMLLAEAAISRYLTGSGLHLALVLSAAALFSILRLGGPVLARPAALACSLAVAFGAWFLFDRGLVPILLSELPGAFHLAVGWHFLLWNISLGARRTGKKRATGTTLETPWLVGGMAAGAIVAWTTGTVQIYSGSEWLIRALGFSVLTGSVLLGTTRKLSSQPRVTAFKEVRGQRFRSRSFLLALILGGVLIAAALVPLSQRLAGRLYGWYGIDDEATSLDEFNSSRPVIQTGSGGNTQSGRKIPRKADIELNNTLRFYLEADDGESFRRMTRREIYTRTSTLSIFADDGQLTPFREGVWRYDGDDGVADGRTTLSEDGIESGETFGYSVLIENRDSRALPLIAHTDSVGLGSIFAYADDWYQLALDDEQERVRFHASAAPRKISELIASGANLEVGRAPDIFRQMPATALVRQVRAEAAILVEDGNRDLETLLPRIQGWLANRCRYSLRYDNPLDLTPIENFLFVEQKGHCELFAAGTVMLLRSLGIPSRVAYGYCGGVADGSKRMMAFRESDFHAWAEIFLDGHGWVIFETTPAGEGAVRPPRIRTGASAFADANLTGYEFLGELDPFETVEVSRLTRFLQSTAELIADWFFAIFAGIAAVGLLLVWLRRGKHRTGGKNDSSLPWPGTRSGKAERPPNFLNDYLQACRSLGFEKRPGQTLGEFLAMLKESGICTGEFDELTRYVYGIRYAGRERDAGREREFRELTKQFAATRRSSEASAHP